MAVMKNSPGMGNAYSPLSAKDFNDPALTGNSGSFLSASAAINGTPVSALTPARRAFLVGNANRITSAGESSANVMASRTFGTASPQFAVSAMKNRVGAATGAAGNVAGIDYQDWRDQINQRMQLNQQRLQLAGMDNTQQSALEKLRLMLQNAQQGQAAYQFEEAKPGMAAQVEAQNISNFRQRNPVFGNIDFSPGTGNRQRSSYAGAV